MILDAFEPGPHLRAIRETAPHWFLPSELPIDAAGKSPDPAEWKARCDEHRQSRGLWLPGDFLNFGGPPTMVTDETQPYQAIAVNCETGTVLDDWARLLYSFPSSPHPLRDWRLRRIDDLCRVIRWYRTVLRDQPDDPATGRLPTDARQPIVATWSWVEKSNGDRWALMHRRTDTTTKPEALTAYGALRILAGALTERLDAIHTGGPTPGLPLSRLLAACGSDPAYWPDSADADLDAATGELLQLQAEGQTAQQATHSNTKGVPPPVGGDESAGPALTVNQSRVLQTMAIFDASRLLSADAIAAEMAPAERLSARTIGPIVRRLIELRLAERPEGDRSGARLTTAGRRLASKTAD